MERRGGIEPPHVRNVAYSHYFRFCFCTPHICSSRLDCHTPHIGFDCETLAQFSAGIVILCEAFCVLSHHPVAIRLLVQMVRICTSHA
nr:MAG TPA: hypothetical protein [Caudoviricetes sp.]